MMSGDPVPRHLTRVILTGEYPPTPGGVSDYTQAVAARLAAAGENVHVWAPAIPVATSDVDNGVLVHRLPGHFGLRDLFLLGRQLDQLPPPVRLLVQYVPHAFGYKAMNLPLCLWLLDRSRKASIERIDIMFHEVTFPLSRKQPIRQNLLGLMNRVMAALICRSATRAFVSTTAWEPFLRPYLSRQKPVVWLPVPSNVATEPATMRAEQVRRTLALEEGFQLLGHFGTYGPMLTQLLGSTFRTLLQSPRRKLLLLGRGGKEFLVEFARETPELVGRIIATGDLPALQVAEHLAACDLLVQPYVDGATTRRGSLAAGLAVGAAIVTTRGSLTEPIWEESKAVALAAPDGVEIARMAEQLLRDPGERRRLGDAARRLYLRKFDLSATVDRLRD